MPGYGVFHVADAFAFGGMADENARFAGSPWGCGEVLVEGGVVVAVGLAHFPPEGAPFVGEGFEGQGFRDGSEALDFVEVDDGGEVIEFVVRGEKNGFPVGAFVAFTVA